MRFSSLALELTAHVHTGSRVPLWGCASSYWTELITSARVGTAFANAE